MSSNEELPLRIEIVEHECKINSCPRCNPPDSRTLVTMFSKHGSCRVKDSISCYLRVTWASPDRTLGINALTTVYLAQMQGTLITAIGFRQTQGLYDACCVCVW